MKTLFKLCLDKKQGLRIMQALMGLLLVVCMQSGLTHTKIELPQKTGNSLMALISDDTRSVISASFMNKVESYFHGGVKIDNCSVDHAADHMLQGEHEHEQGHEQEHGAESSHPKDSLSGFYPVKWINSKIHAQEHRHLAHKRSVELLPWIVAATRASPHNIQSYQVGSYILSRMVDKSQIAVDFLQEGIKNNPANFELEVSLAEIFFHRVKDKERARKSFERAFVKSQSLGRELSEEEVFVEMKIYFYLGVMAKERGDINRLREVLQMASKANPSNTVTLSLAKWLAELESAK